MVPGPADDPDNPVGRGVAEGVLGHLRPGNVNRPLPQPVLAIGPQKPTHVLVNSLHLPVTLGVKTCGEADRDPQAFHKRPPYFRRELGTPIRNYILRHPVVLEDVGEQGLHSLWSRRETVQRKETAGLRKPIHNDQDRGVAL